MPGSNEYSMAPELRATETTPTLTSKTASRVEKKDTGLPLIYKTQVYDPTTFDEAAFANTWFKNDYGSKASKGDVRKFNRFKNSEEYIKALAEAKAKAKADFDAAERQKWSDSYKAYSTALSELFNTRRNAENQKLRDDIAKVDVNPQLKPKWSATKASVDAGAPTYKVQAGNTLGQIVADYNKKNPGANLKWQDVAKWSGIADPSKMRIGHVINFADPTAQSVEQQPGQTVDTNTEQNTEQNTGLPGGNTKPALDSLGIKSPIDSTGLAVADSLAAKNGPAAPQLDSAAIAAAIDSADVKIANILKASGAPSTDARTSFDLASMMANRGWKPSTIQIPKFQYSTFNKQGGTMNRINYFQLGGVATQQQDIQQQVVALVQAAMQGDQKATETVNKIMEAAKAGDQQAVQLAQMIQQVVEQMKGQATAAKWGAKLGYIKSLKYAKGGKACPACEKGKQVEMKACGGKKAKKRYFGGLV